MHRIAVLGSTGSIGTSALDVIRGLGEPYRLVGLAAGSQWKVVANQAREFRPSVAALSDDRAAKDLAAELDGAGIEVLSGPEGVLAVAGHPDVDMVVVGISGAAALPATLAAIRAGKRVCLANKEALVMAGHLLKPMAREKGADIIPVDSEHSALYQALHSGRKEEVSRVLLTASGGPFRDWTKERLKRVTPEEALKHPTWDMGKKITIDSATLMNKSLEIIEARWLFDVPADKIEVVIHPQSIVHSMVEFCDGSVVAQMGLPDMRVPIQLAMTYPRRMKSPVSPPDWAKVRMLTFDSPDHDRFPSLRMGYRAAREGGSLGTVLNAANEIAVERFLRREIAFPEIFDLVRAVMDSHSVKPNPSLEEVFATDGWAREKARTWRR